MMPLHARKPGKIGKKFFGHFWAIAGHFPTENDIFGCFYIIKIVSVKGIAVKIIL